MTDNTHGQVPEALPAIQRFEVVDCIDDKHVPAVIPKPHGPWVRYEDHIAALAAGQATAAKQAPECPSMPETWHVVAHVLGEPILSIGYDWLSGKGELTEAETQAVIGMAQHMLAFVGYGLPPSSFDPDADEATAAQAVVPAGWKLVPTEPTHNMLAAMAECDGWLPGDRDRPGLTRWEDYWRMAIAAAPPQPAAQQGAAYAAPPSHEHQLAIMEGERNASLDAYSRVVYLTSAESRLYEAGFTNGWDRRDRLASHGQAPAQEAPAAVVGASEAVAYLDIGAGGYLDLGTDLTDEALSRLSKGRHALVIAGTYGIDGYIAAPIIQPAPQHQARPVTPYTCPKCSALWLHWPAEQSGFGMDTLNCRSTTHCDYCEKGGVEQLQRLERVPAVLAAPQPSPAAQGDALDAERLDWLTFNLSGKALRDIGVVWSEHGDARRAIDAARAAQEGK